MVVIDSYPALAKPPLVLLSICTLGRHFFLAFHQLATCLKKMERIWKGARADPATLNLPFSHDITPNTKRASLSSMHSLSSV